MKLIADMHTHTVSSGHAYSTVTENLKVASEKGIKLLAMTDHTPMMPGGPHVFHFANLKALPKELFGVRLLKGAEINIMDYEGTLDLEEEVLADLDVGIASLHPPCIEFADAKTVTKGLLKVMENPYINIIGHPGDSRYPFDIEKIVLASKETGTLLEVNQASLKPNSFRPGIRENLVQLLSLCKANKMPVVVGSDAHFALEIGEFRETLALFEEVDFPEHLVLNTNPEALLAFIAQKRLK